jgi:hypothetical protein
MVAFFEYKMVQAVPFEKKNKPQEPSIVIEKIANST